MHGAFQIAIESLHPSFLKLTAMAPLRCPLPKDMPRSGVYLFSENERHLYVGRSRSLRRRYGRHCNKSATHRMAAFAFQLAREVTGFQEPSYKTGSESREGLMAKPEFARAFADAKARIRAMDYRCVEENDPLRQALLEIYCAVGLSTPYNDFDTH